MQVDANTLASVLRKLRRCVAPGPSMFTNDHLLTLFPVETDADVQALTPLLAFVNKVLTGDVDEETAEFLAGATLAALYKSDGAGGLKRRPDGKLDVRPIAIPETLYRVIALCGLAACHADLVAVLTASLQLSVGVSSACEGIVAAARLYMEEVLDGNDAAESAEPLLRACCNLDASNAFNTIDRDVMLTELKAVAPGLLPLVRLVYCREGRLVLPNHGAGEERFRVFVSRTGSRQGDPLGPVLFALGALSAMRKVQEKHPDVDLPSFVDDVNGFVEARGAAALSVKVDGVVSDLVEEYDVIGVGFNATKCEVYCPASPGLVLTTGVKQVVDGTKMLGAPLGTADYQVLKARKRLSGSLEQLALLPQLDFGDAMLILRKSIVPRASYLAGVLPPAVMAGVLAEWDAAIWVCLTKLFGRTPHPRCFASGPGCLGIIKMANELSLIRVQGWERSKAVVQKHFPRLAHLTAITHASAHPVHVEITTAWASLPASVTSADGVISPHATPAPVTPPADGGLHPLAPASPNTVSPPSTDDKAAVEASRKLKDAFREHQRSVICDSLDPQGLAIFASASAPGARAWADAAPGVGMPSLSADGARIAYCLWLGMPIPEIATASDPLGRARLRTDRGGTTRRHNGFVSTVCDIMVEAGYRVWTEVTGLYGAFPPGMSPSARGRGQCGEDRRMDIAGVNAALKAKAVDPTVVDTANPSERASPAEVLAAAEAHKVEHYVGTPAPFEFHAVAAGIETNLGPAATAFLRELSDCVARRQNGGQDPSDKHKKAVWRRTRARVGRALMGQLVWQVSSAFVASPHHALVKKKSYVHSAQRPWTAARVACVCAAAAKVGKRTPRDCCCNAQQSRRA